MPFLRPHHSFTYHVLFFWLGALAIAGVVNRTIDDELGDSVTGQKLVYFPPDPTVWKTGQTCGAACVAHLNASRVFQRTWTEAVHRIDTPELIDTMLSITANFSGTAVYVYNILAQGLFDSETIPPTEYVTYLTFELDGNHVGTFSADDTLGLTYGVPVYANESLSDGPHTLVIRVPCDPQNNSLSFVLFDYIEYTTIDPASSSTLPISSPPAFHATSRIDTSPSQSRSNPSGTPSTVTPVSPNTTTSISSSTMDISALSPTNPPAPPTITAVVHDLSHTAPVAPIVGGAVGGTALLAIAGILAFRTRRARKPAPHLRQTSHPSRDDYALHHTLASEEDPPARTVTFARWSMHSKARSGAGPSSTALVPDFEDDERAATYTAGSSVVDVYEGSALAVGARHPRTARELPRPPSAFEEARLRALEEAVSRMQALMEVPPQYESDDPPIRDTSRVL